MKDNGAILNTGQRVVDADVLKIALKLRKKVSTRAQRRIAAGKTKAKRYKGGNITSNNYKQLN